MMFHQLVNLPHQPKQNHAEGVTAKIKVNLTQLMDHMGHPVHTPYYQVLRSYLEPHELPYFDARVIPAKTAALVAIHGLQGQSLDRADRLQAKLINQWTFLWVE